MILDSGNGKITTIHIALNNQKIKSNLKKRYLRSTRIEHRYYVILDIEQPL